MRAIVRLAYEATCAFVPLAAVIAVRARRRRGPGPRSGRGPSRGRLTALQVLGMATFAVYVLFVMWVCGVGTLWDFLRGGAVGWRSQVNLDAFSPWLNPVTWLLNVVLFVPLGFLLPCLWRGYDRLWQTTAFGFCFSLAIELSQLLNFRITDVDDLIANTLGALVGVLVFRLLRRVFPRLFAGAGPRPAGEPVAWLAAMFGGVFFLYAARGHAEMRIVAWLDRL